MLLKFPKNLLYFVLPLGLYFLAAPFLQKPLGLWGISMAQIILLALPAYLGMRALGEKWGSFPNLKNILLTLGLTFVALCLIDIFMSVQEFFLPMSAELKSKFSELIQMETKTQALSKILILAVTPAFCEELLFRGFLQPLWKKELGNKGVVLASFCFALCHGNFLYFHFYFLLGLFLAGIKEWKQNLWLCVLAHLANNLWTLFFASY